MSGIRYNADDYARATDPVERRLRGAIRRYAIDLTSRGLWRLLGYLLPDGQRETVTAEVFSGIGFYARPPAGAKPEAIALHVGGAEHPVIVATRDEKTRAAVVGGIAADETAVHNSQALVHVKADGSIEARSAGGAAVALATKADLDTVMAAIAAAIAALSGVAPELGALQTALQNAGFPVGTQVFKAE